MEKVRHPLTREEKADLIKDPNERYELEQKLENSGQYKQNIEAINQNL